MPTTDGEQVVLRIMHRALLDDPSHVIMTIENPVENQIRGINHIEISPKSGLTFARGLRTIPRSDPTSCASARSATRRRRGSRCRRA
jgi:type II secretory ATPase GspE/PulE/Tfp pilus assembly ATPase PilB-like protein